MSDLPLYLLSLVGLFALLRTCMYYCTWVWNVFLKPGSDLSEYKGEWALVTGGASAIGKQFCIQLAKQGIHVAILDVNKAMLEQTAEECRALGVQVKTGLLDFCLPHNEVQQKLQAFLDKHEIAGRISVLVNNVGGNPPPFTQWIRQNASECLEIKNAAPPSAPYAHMSFLEFNNVPLEASVANAMFQLLPTMITTRTLLPNMVQMRKGLVIIMSSASGFAGVPYNREYGGGKAFLRVWANALEAEVKQHNIHVQAVCPGFIQTDLTAGLKLPFNVEASQFVQWALHRCTQGSFASGHPTHCLLRELVPFMPPTFGRDSAQKSFSDIIGGTCRLMVNSDNSAKAVGGHTPGAHTTADNTPKEGLKQA